MNLHFDISLGEILTIASVLIASFSLLFAIQKYRQMRRKAFAEKIRNAAGMTLAKLERRKELLQGFFINVQPLYVDADMELVKSNDPLAVRDMVWGALSKEYGQLRARILDEEIEMAYVELQGFSPNVQALYQDAMKGFAEVEAFVWEQLRVKTQREIVNLRGLPGHKPAFLGNLLREVTAKVAAQSQSEVDFIVQRARVEMGKLTQGSDKALYARTIRVENTMAGISVSEKLKAKTEEIWASPIGLDSRDASSGPSFRDLSSLHCMVHPRLRRNLYGSLPPDT